MHRFRTVKDATGFLICALALCISFFLLLLTLAALVQAVLSEDTRWQVAAISFVGVAAVSWLFYRMVAGGYNCPLCMNPLLLSKNCNRNHRAKTFLGSYRLRIAISAIFKGSIRCSYCGEVTLCEGRQKGVASSKTEKGRGRRR